MKADYLRVVDKKVECIFRIIINNINSNYPIYLWICSATPSAVSAFSQ